MTSRSTSTLILIAAIIAAILTSAPTASAQSAEYLLKVDSAQAAIKDERWTDAERHLLAAMRMQPGLPSNCMLMSNLGIVRFQGGDSDGALTALSDAIAMAPNAEVLIANRARVLTALNRDREAIADYTRLLCLDSLSTVGLLNRGMLSLGADDMATAEHDLRLLARIAPKSRDAALAMASLLSRRGEFNEAIPYYDRLIELAPSDEAYLGRATCFIMTERLSDAAYDLNEAIRLNPLNPDLYRERAKVNRLNYRNAEADADLRHADLLENKSARQ